MLALILPPTGLGTGLLLAAPANFAGLPLLAPLLAGVMDSVAVHGWIAWKLYRPQIRAEFRHERHLECRDE